MEIIIAGIIAAIVITNPLVSKFRNIDVHNIIRHSVYEINNKKNIDLSQIDSINRELEDLQYNFRKLTKLIKSKEEIVIKVEDLMNTHSQMKTTFTEEQINSFIEFTKLYQEKNIALSNDINIINNKKDIITLKKEVLLENSNYKEIFEEINDINISQINIINELEEIIDKAINYIELI